VPFPDNAFDFVCSSQVLEHVANLGATLAELARVTKPTGVHLHVFPTKECIMEGHLGVPLIHRLPERHRRKWARLFYRRANFAAQTDSFDEWWAELGPFLAEHTFYRTSNEYDVAFRRHFKVKHVERPKLAYHLAERRLTPMASMVPRSLELIRVGSAVELSLRPSQATAVGPVSDSAVED
jgi:SAM-dependent methyltransferase